MNDIKFEVHTVPVLDTGLGREAGYASDREMMKAAQAKRDAMSPVERELAEKLDRMIDIRFLGL